MKAWAIILFMLTMQGCQVYGLDAEGADGRALGDYSSLETSRGGASRAWCCGRRRPSYCTWSNAGKVCVVAVYTAGVAAVVYAGTKLLGGCGTVEGACDVMQTACDSANDEIAGARDQVGDLRGELTGATSQLTDLRAELGPLRDAAGVCGDLLCRLDPSKCKSE